MDTLAAAVNHTVDQIFDRYEAEVLPLKAVRTRKDYARHIEVLRQYFGSRAAAGILRQELITFMDVDTGRIHRNRMLAVLSAAFTEAVSWGWLNSNVCIGIPRNRSDSKPRYVTAAEFEGFKAMSPPSLWHAMELARYTGQLQGGILSLKWSDVHEKRGVITFRDAKRRNRKIEVAITAPIRAVLAACKGTEGRRVFVVATLEGDAYTSEGFRSMWQRYMNAWIASGNARFTFHDIRWTWSVQEKVSSKKITFIPSVFQVPDGPVERDLVAVMMPFKAEFDGVYDAMRRACADCELRCLRASDIWESVAIIQDIFSLIYRAQIVIVDFSGRNPNVMYETGIAHTLGKTVVPLSQSIDDVPFDIQHHRVLRYLANREGLEELRSRLAARLGFIVGRGG